MQETPDAPGNRVLGISPGDQIGGRYEIVRVLGVGGTGAVFEARHMTIGRTVAIKLLLPELAQNPVVPQRFLQEARTANEVRHKNIVEVIDFGADNGRLYMVMEFLHGESLADYILREAPVAPGPIIRILEPIMGALAAAHARGIVHRDVKPQNIFLQRTEGDDEPVPKLIDFGIAKRLVGGDVNLTSTGMILGTPAYMSPEQARADRTVTHAADQYSLGVIFYQALTGNIPYDADSYPALLIQIVSQPPVDILQRRPDLDPGLAAVVMRMLARTPSHRYASFADLRLALRPWRDVDERTTTREALRPEVAAPTRPDGSRESTPEPVTVQLPQKAISSVPAPMAPSTPPAPAVMSNATTEGVYAPPPAAPSRLGLLAAFVGVMAVGMVSLAVWLAVRSDGRPKPPPPPAVDASRPAETVTLRIDVEPPVAEISLDGVVVGHGHAELLRPRDDRRLQLRLSAPGFAAVSDVLSCSTDARVSRVLVSLTAPTPPPRQNNNARVVGSAPPPPPPPPPPPQQNIDPPVRNHEHPRIDPTNPFR
ncbi:MAG: protein kinase [Polyangiales bacterium]